MKRGDIVTVSVAGDYGKPRPAVFVQSDRLSETDSVLVCLLTSATIDTVIYRLPIEPSAANGLTRSSDIMADKIIAMPRRKCGKVIGEIGPSAMADLDGLLMIVMGLVG